MSRTRTRPRPAPPRPRTDAPSPRPAWPWIVAAIFAVALLWRLLYLARLAGTPLAGSRLADAQSYWDWASYLLAHGPAGKNPFFLAPLYPYALALVRLLTGNDAQHVLWVQSLWGAAAAALLADAAKRFAGPWAGVAIGLAVAFSRMAVFFDGLVLGESLLFALAALLLWSVARTAHREPGMRDALAWGALAGLLAQGRATAALLALPILLLFAQTATSRAAALRRGGAALLAMALVCAPAAIRNAAVSHEWIPFTYNAGYNLYVGDNPYANGSFVSVTGTRDITDPARAGEDGGVEGDGRTYIRETTGADLSPNASSRWWAARARAWMAAHPGAAARLAWTKLVLAWSRHEAPQIENVEEFRLLAGPVGLPWLGFFPLLAALGMAGVFVAWQRGPHARFLALHALLVTAGLLPFFVTDRYRHHLAAPLLLLAAIAADAAWRAWRERRMPVAAAAGGALGLTLAFAPVPHGSAARTAMTLAGDVGMRWLEHGRADLAERELARAVAMDDAGAVRWLATPDDSLNRAVFRVQHARALTALGRDADALAEARRAAELAPGSREIAGVLAAAYAAAGDTARAAGLYAGAGRANGAVEAEVTRGWALARAGRLADAEGAFAAVVARDPKRFDAWGALVRLRCQAGRKADARTAFDRALAAGWSGPAADAHAALLLALEGDREGARRALARVTQSAADADPVLRDVMRAARGVLGTP